MPTIKKKKSVIKRARQNDRARTRNVLQRSRLKTAVKKVRTAENQEAAKQELVKTVPVIDRMADKGIIHKNKAARHKSRLNGQIKALAQAAA